MGNKETEAYFRVQNGYEATRRQLGVTASAIDVFQKEGKVVEKIPLGLFGEVFPHDNVISMPDRVRLRETREALKIEQAIEGIKKRK